MDKLTKPYYTKAEIVIYIFQILMQFLLYHSTACLITGIGNEENGWMYLRLGILFVPLLLYLFTRMYVKNLLIFALIHLGCAGGLFFLFPRHLGEAAAIFICLLIMLINSIRFRIVESNECPNLLLSVFFLIVYIFAEYIEKTLLTKLCFYEFIVFLLLFMISKNLENTEKFITLNQNTANFPIRQIKGVNRTLLCFFAVVMLVGMLLAPQLHPELVAEQVGNVWLLFLRWLFSFFQMKEIDSESILDSIYEQEQGFGMPIEEAVPSKLAIFLQYFMEILTGIFLVAVILFGIGFGLYQIYKRFYAIPLKAGNEQKEADVVTVTEHVPIFLKKKEEEEKRDGYSRKIRRQYKKSVKRRKGKTKVLSKSLTPTEIENVLEHPLSEAKERERRVVLYEKARYGREECTKEELEEMRKMV